MLFITLDSIYFSRTFPPSPLCYNDHSANIQGRNMVYGLRAQSPKCDWDQGSEERAQGSEEWDQGSQGFWARIRDQIYYKNLLQYFPLNKVCVHSISWPSYIAYSCFRLAAVPVIWSPGCLTKTWSHILNLLIVESTVIWISSHFSRFVTQLLNALSTPKGRESDLYVPFFARNGEEEKDKKKSCDRERYASASLTDLLLARVQA